MKRLISVWAILLLAVVACNAPVNPKETPIPPTSAEPTTIEPTSVAQTPEPTSAEQTPEASPEPTNIPTDTPDEGGFTTGNLTSSLPDLENYVPIIDFYYCDPPSECPEEGIQVVGFFHSDQVIRLYGYPTEGINRVRITSDGPFGSNYSTFYTSNGKVYDSDDIEVGIASNGEWSFTIHIAAWFPQYEWTFTSELIDGALKHSTTHTSSAPYMSFTAFDPPPQNPFVTLSLTNNVAADYYEADYVFPPGSEVFVYGQNYDPNTTFTLAMYLEPLNEDDLAEGVAATTITTDENGSWQTSYIFPVDALLRSYFFIKDPDTTYTWFDVFYIKLRE